MSAVVKHEGAEPVEVPTQVPAIASETAAILSVIERAAQNPNPNPNPFYTVVNRLLRYDPNTGLFTWRVNRGGTATVGTRAGTIYSGRVHVKVLGSLYYAHRLAVLLMTREWPADVVDHIDGNPLNNAWCNLRVCSRGQNLQNKRVSRSNRSGLLGVSRHGNAWQATIRINHKHIHLGRFSDPESAHQAYLAAKAIHHCFNPQIARERASA